MFRKILAAATLASIVATSVPASAASVSNGFTVSPQLAAQINAGWVGFTPLPEPRGPIIVWPPKKPFPWPPGPVCLSCPPDDFRGRIDQSVIRDHLINQGVVRGGAFNQGFGR